LRDWSESEASEDLGEDRGHLLVRGHHADVGGRDLTELVVVLSVLHDDDHVVHDVGATVGAEAHER
jgi:hypothetical protein